MLLLLTLSHTWTADTPRTWCTAFASSFPPAAAIVSSGVLPNSLKPSQSKNSTTAPRFPTRRETAALETSRVRRRAAVGDAYLLDSKRVGKILRRRRLVGCLSVPRCWSSSQMQPSTGNVYAQIRVEESAQIRWGGGWSNQHRGALLSILSTTNDTDAVRGGRRAAAVFGSGRPPTAWSAASCATVLSAQDALYLVSGWGCQESHFFSCQSAFVVPPCCFHCRAIPPTAAAFDRRCHRRRRRRL